MATPLVRRIRESDINKLEAFFKTDLALEQNFKNYSGWLSEAIQDLKSQKKIAFGAFLQRNSKSSTNAQSLMACAFVKRQTESVEIKGLAVRGRRFDSPLRTTKRQCFLHLIQKILRFCEARDFRNIELEVPHGMRSELALLLELQFKVISQRERYPAGNFFYVLQRKIGDTYQSDPFDLLRLGKWICRKIIPSEPTTEFHKLGGQSGVHSIRFSTAPFHSKSLSSQQSSSEFTVSGQMLVVKRPVNNRFTFTNLLRYKALDLNCQLKYILIRTCPPRFAKQCRNRGFKLITLKDSYQLAGRDSSSLRIPIQGEDIRGVITALDQEKIKDLAKHESFTYFLLSGRGIGLNFDSGVPEKQYLAIYCPQWKSKHVYSSGIVGYCRILETAVRKYENAYEAFEVIEKTGHLRHQALSRVELKYYSTFSDDEHVYVLLCDQIKLIEPANPPLAITKVSANRKIVSYIDDELTKNWVTSVYFENSVLKNIKSHLAQYGIFQRTIPTKPRKSFGAFISYSRDDDKKLIAELKNILSDAGFNIIQDNSHLKPSYNIKKFIRDSTQSDRVFICFSLSYKDKCREEGTGLNDEWPIICASYHHAKEHDLSSRFVAIKLDNSIGKVPSPFIDDLAMDFTKRRQFKNQIRQMFKELHGVDD